PLEIPWWYGGHDRVTRADRWPEDLETGVDDRAQGGRQMPLLSAPQIALFLISGVLLQEQPRAPVLPPGDLVGEDAAVTRRTVLWNEGTAIPLRVPVAATGKEFMTSVSFPEEGIETAVTGWKDGEITAVQKRGLLFLRLAKK